MVRYWVGRRDPTKAYSTHGEGSLLAKTGNNTYFLYRAQFSPYNDHHRTAKTPDGTTINEHLFMPQRTDRTTAKVLCRSSTTRTSSGV